MIFSETWEEVLSGEKTQTSRLWKDDYTFSYDEYDREFRNIILSIKAFEAGKIRKLYEVGQIRGVQKGRGQKSIAKIRILELSKRDVRTFTDAEIKAEGFETPLDFYITWCYLHFPVYLKLLATEMVDAEWWLKHMKAALPEQYTALVIKFELIENKGE